MKDLFIPSWIQIEVMSWNYGFSGVQISDSETPQAWQPQGKTVWDSSKDTSSQKVSINSDLKI